MMKSRTFGILISILFCSLGVAPGSPARSSEINRPTSQPYTGNLSTFENAKRAKNLQIDRVMDLLGIRAGSVVADIGAGGGWFSVRAARRVGPRGIVYAEDINPPYVKEITARARREKLPNIRAILGKPDDPQLPAMSVNAVLFLKAYHEIAHPIVLLRHVRAALRPEGRLGIIDRTGNGANHGVDPNDVMQELRRAGFFFVAKYDFVKADGEDYFLIFR
jgi:ubiquinone/menaquinone biosynthesis C-methylase UbiE